MLMLLSMHVTNVLFLVLFNNFAQTMHGLLLELHALTLVACSYALLARADSGIGQHVLIVVNFEL